MFENLSQSNGFFSLNLASLVNLRKQCNICTCFGTAFKVYMFILCYVHNFGKYCQICWIRAQIWWNLKMPYCFKVSCWYSHIQLHGVWWQITCTNNPYVSRIEISGCFEHNADKCCCLSSRDYPWSCAQTNQSKVTVGCTYNILCHRKQQENKGRRSWHELVPLPSTCAGYVLKLVIAISSYLRHMLLSKEVLFWYDVWRSIITPQIQFSSYVWKIV